MDKPIEKKRASISKFVLIGTAIALTGALGAAIISRSGSSSLHVVSDRLTIDSVVKEEFQEYIPVSGTVEPKTTVFLDLEEGGIVEQIHIPGGSPVNAGDLIISFSNNTVQKQNIDSETRLLENLNQLRNSKIALTEKHLILKDQLLDLDYQILEQQKSFNRFKALIDKNSTQVSRETYESSRDTLAYLKQKRNLLTERIQQEDILSHQQNTQVDESIQRVNKSLQVLSQIAESLELRAPIDGFLSSMNVDVGQNFQRGQRIGQIDQANGFIVRARVDQYYIAKIEVGQTGQFKTQGSVYFLRVDKIYPEVTNNQFIVDLAFTDTELPQIKRGQTLSIDLNLSQSRSTLVANKGGFFRYTRGRWVYLISEDGLSAKRVPIVSGRQNPRKFEVVEGLAAHDRIITSSYDLYKEVDVLQFDTPIGH